MDDELTKHQLAEMKESFDYFDLNGDGNISVQELNKAMHLLGNNPTDEDIKLIMAETDLNKNGVIDFEEFCKLMQKYLKSHLDEEQSLRDAFAVFDRNKDGSVSVEEIKNVLKEIGQEIDDEEISLMMSQAQLDSKGGLDYKAFVKVMSSKVL